MKDLGDLFESESKITGSHIASEWHNSSNIIVQDENRTELLQIIQSHPFTFEISEIKTDTTIFCSC